MNTLYFPIALMVLDIGAGVVYYLQGDWKKGTYWMAAFVLTLMITLEK